ncbi:hypothetical protein [Spirosoma fluviale]|uniref:DUF3828 domain-containing protein n=1 Tax=Spirosoma fluviale TaxID=1597977 RepID=A0A286G1V7_9BACT|nr:hypothetical protein [Spirosoma fluviale]SOD89527.1 hypothetical protein SAMN06269250_3097 [Spirosoma fluviale]
MKTPLLLTALVLISLACKTKPKQEAQTTSTTAVEDSAAALAKRPTDNTPRSAADRLVRALYFEHNKTENPMRETKDRALIEQFFAKSTAELIWNDAQKSTGKLNRKKINGLYNVPDEAIKKTWVLPAVVGGTRAIVYVTFENKAKPEEIKVEMQQTAGRWRITDMRYPDGTLLTQLVQ